jgi:membrane-associated HD superfamily phosphohydrolase
MIILFSSSLFKTGCIFYPVNKTCFSTEAISWSEKDSIKNYSKIVALWAKGYWVQNDSKYEKIDDTKIFLQNFKWFKFWIEKHFFYKIFEFLLIIIGSVILIYIYFKKDKSTLERNNKDTLVMFLLSLFSILFWLNTVPQFRFGFSSIIIFTYLSFKYFVNLNIYFSKKKFFHLLILGLVVLNLKNINRINSEFERDDFYKFKDFPFYNEKLIKYDYSNFKVKKFLHIEIIE